MLSYEQFYNVNKQIKDEPFSCKLQIKSLKSGNVLMSNGSYISIDALINSIMQGKVCVTNPSMLKQYSEKQANLESKKLIAEKNKRFKNDEVPFNQILSDVYDDDLACKYVVQRYFTLMGKKSYGNISSSEALEYNNIKDCYFQQQAKVLLGSLPNKLDINDVVKKVRYANNCIAKSLETLGYRCSLQYNV